MLKKKVDEKSMKVGYQGIPGCYSEGALVSLFKDQVFLNNFQKFEQLVTNGFPTNDLLVKELLNGNIDFCLMPIESNLAGSFHSVLDLIVSNDVSIQGEIKYSESCCLLGCPESSLDDIKEIRAHFLILGQCTTFLGKFKKISLAGDTAQAAKELAEENLNNVGVIGGKRAAKLYGLKVLKDDIQDDKVNITRFFLLSKAKDSQNLIPRYLNPSTFVVVHCKNTPGTFYKALSCFALRDINVSKIESRSSSRSKSLGNPWEYVLYIEADDSIGSTNLMKAIENLKEYCQTVKVVGSFPRYQPDLTEDAEFTSGIGM